MKADWPSEEAYRRAAARIRCEVAAIKAVAEVEAGPGGAFLDSGEPVILFERHIFHELTDGRHAGARAPGAPASCSVISLDTQGGYGPYSAQHARLQAAVDLDRTAALMSASWGLFQILGRYSHETGHTTLQGFITAMYEGVDAHLDAFVALVLYRHLGDEIREHRWADFAIRYNGKAYRKNRYDDKLAAAYAKHKAVG